MDSFVLVIGLAALAQGFPYLVSPKRARARIKRWLNQEDMTFRFYGGIACGIGLLIMYLGLF